MNRLSRSSLSSLRAETAGLHQLLTRLGGGPQALLLVLVDSLVLIDILQRWGRANFNPCTKDIMHFDVIFPLVKALRQWQYPVGLVKVKGRTGCLLNERVEKMAERYYSDDAQEVCRPGVCRAPQKHGSMWLKVQQHIRRLAAHCQKQLPRDNASNQNLRKQAVGASTRRVVSMRSTIFARQLLHQLEGATIAHVVTRCREAE
jgi:hypothetical protein